MRQFGRQVRVTIGPAGMRGRSWSELRTEFEVVRTASREPNTCTVSLFNLSRDSRSWIKQDGNRLVLDAGYEGNVQRIFVGDIARVSTERRDADLVTMIECGDGEKFFRQARVALRFPRGATLSQILQAMIDEAKARNEISAASVRVTSELTYTALQGMSVWGYSRDVLDRIVRTAGAEWSVQDGVLEVVPAGQAVEQVGIAANDLYYVKELLEDRTGRAREKRGWALESQMDGTIRPNRAVRVPGIDGWWRVTEVKHDGETHNPRRWKSYYEVDEIERSA